MSYLKIILFYSLCYYVILELFSIYDLFMSTICFPWHCRLYIVQFCFFCLKLLTMNYIYKNFIIFIIISTYAFITNFSLIPFSWVCTFKRQKRNKVYSLNSYSSVKTQTITQFIIYMQWILSLIENKLIICALGNLYYRISR